MADVEYTPKQAKEIADFTEKRLKLEKLINAESEKAAEKTGKAYERHVQFLKKKATELKHLKKQEELAKSITDLNEEELDVKDRAAVAQYDLTKGKEKEKKLLETAKKLLNNNEKFSKKELQTLDKKLATELSILKEKNKAAELAKKQIAGEERLLEITGDLRKNATAMVDAAKEMAAAALKNPMLAIGAAVVGLVKLFETLVNSSKQFQEQIKGSVSQGDQLTKQLAGAQINAKLLGYDAAAAAGALVDEFGSINDVNSESVKTMGLFEKGLGISTTTSAKLMKSMKGVSGLTQEQSLDLIKSGAAMAKINGVAPGAIMEDIANNTEEFAKYGSDGGKNMIRAAIHAKKLGLELSTLTKTSDSLLDFESSIAAEMEASMLIGKQMNLNKAREKALSGDLAGMAEEIKKQVGGQAEFEKMNVIQREALAASVGMNAEELSKMMSGEVAVKGEMDKISAEEVLSKDLNENSLRMRNLLTAQNLLTVATYALVAAMAFNSLTSGKLGKYFKGFGANLGKQLGGFFTKAKGLGGKALGSVGKGAKALGKGAITGVKSVGKGVLSGAKALGKGAITGVKSVGKGALNVAKVAKGSVGKTAAKVAGKGAGKALLKKIPGIGLVAGLGFAAGRLMKGDALGALGEVASGAASLIPGIGTAVSTAIDVGMIARDASKAAKDTAETVKDTTKVQIKEREAIIQKEKSMSNLSKQQVEAKKAAEDAIIEEKKLNEKKAAKLVEQQKVQVEKPKGPSKEKLEEQLGKLRVGEKMNQRAIARYKEDGITPDEKQKIAQQERAIESNRQQQAALLDAIKKLTQTTANLKND